MLFLCAEGPGRLVLSRQKPGNTSVPLLLRMWRAPVLIGARSQGHSCYSCQSPVLTDQSIKTGVSAWGPPAHTAPRLLPAQLECAPKGCTTLKVDARGHLCCLCLGCRSGLFTCWETVCGETAWGSTARPRQNTQLLGRCRAGIPGPTLSHLAMGRQSHVP